MDIPDSSRRTRDRNIGPLDRWSWLARIQHLFEPSISTRKETGQRIFERSRRCSNDQISMMQIGNEELCEFCVVQPKYFGVKAKELVCGEWSQWEGVCWCFGHGRVASAHNSHAIVILIRSRHKDFCWRVHTYLASWISLLFIGELCLGRESSRPPCMGLRVVRMTWLGTCRPGMVVVSCVKAFGKLEADMTFTFSDTRRLEVRWGKHDESFSRAPGR